MHIAASAGAEKALRIAALKAKRDALQAESVAKRARSNPLVTPEEEARERARISDAAIRKKGLESALGSGTPADSVFFRHSITSDNLLELASSVGPRFLSRGVIHFFLLFILSVFATNAIVLVIPSVLLCSLP